MLLVTAGVVAVLVALLREGGFYPLKEINPAQRKALIDHNTNE